MLWREIKGQLESIASTSKTKRARAIATWLANDEHGPPLLANVHDVRSTILRFIKQRRLTGDMWKVLFGAAKQFECGYWPTETVTWRDRLTRLLSRDLTSEQRLRLDGMRKVILTAKTIPSKEAREFVRKLEEDTKPKPGEPIYPSLNTRTWCEMLESLDEEPESLPDAVVDAVLDALRDANLKPILPDPALLEIEEGEESGETSAEPSATVVRDTDRTPDRTPDPLSGLDFGFDHE